MREISLRAWDKEKNIMIIDLISFGKNKDGTTWISHSNTFNNSKNGYMWGCRNLEIMQFTGLTDCHGTKIYDGDIVKANGYVDAKYIIKWDESSASWFPKLLNPEYGCTYGTTWKDQICNDEVIGNIYENSNLLNNE